MNSKITYRLIWGCCRLIGLLPLRLQFLLSDIVYILLYHVFSYRISVTRENLLNSFPNKSKKEINEIERKFYRHLSDVFIESIVVSSFTEKQIRQRIVYPNIEIFHEANKDRPIIVAMAHYGSWEFTIGYPLHTENEVMAVYHPLSSKAVDMYYRRMRSLFGTKPVAMSSIAKELLVSIRAGGRAVVALLADQSPPRPQIKEWIPFLNQPTAFFQGMEKLALKYNLSVIFMDISKVRRGYYSAEYTLLFDGKEEVKDGEITRRYAKILEDAIIREPHLWMWSHRRWKHKPEK